MKKIIYLTLILLVTNLANAVEPIVNAGWLNKNLDKVFILDIRNKIDGGSYETFKEGHIPGSVHSDYLKAGWRAKVNGVIGQFPGTKALDQLVGSLGIESNDHVVIVYGGINSTDFGSAARIYWTLKTIGHENVSILNGGFKEWEKENYKVVSGEHKLNPTKFKSKLNKKYFATFSEVKKAEKEKNGLCLIDARPNAFFIGEKKKEQARTAGRIKNAVNLEQQNMTGDNGKIKSAVDIKKMFTALKVEKYKGYISYCNTGHWAATVWFALSEQAEIPNVKLYDGSMVGWTINPKNEVVSG
jgi:thiosulfate/3-mercaptopyruvate sulfurtransferase